MLSNITYFQRKTNQDFVNNKANAKKKPSTTEQEALLE